MSFRRISIASMFAVIWFSAVLHCDLEAMGWMFEHEHSHVHADDTESNHSPLSDGQHEPICHWDLALDGRVVLPALLMLIVIPLIGLLTWINLRLRLRIAECRFILQRCEDVFSNSWQFIWRCASESTAPPVLS